jgi:hypothetical protein
MRPLAVILAVDTRQHAVVVLEPEQEHVETCDDEEEICDCPVVSYDTLHIGTARTQEERSEAAMGAFEAAGGGHEEDCEDEVDCECSTAPAIQVVVVTDDAADAETWGRWLAELEHLGIDQHVVKAPLVELFGEDLQAAIEGTVNKLAQERLEGPPMGHQVALAVYLAQWVQKASVDTAEAAE